MALEQPMALEPPTTLEPPTAAERPTALERPMAAERSLRAAALRKTSARTRGPATGPARDRRSAGMRDPTWALERAQGQRDARRAAFRPGRRAVPEGPVRRREVGPPRSALPALRDARAAARWQSSPPVRCRARARPPHRRRASPTLTARQSPAPPRDTPGCSRRTWRRTSRRACCSAAASSPGTWQPPDWAAAPRRPPGACARPATRSQRARADARRARHRRWWSAHATASGRGSRRAARSASTRAAASARDGAARHRLDACATRPGRRHARREPAGAAPTMVRRDLP